MEVGKNLLKILSSKGITQYRLSKLTGIPQSTLSDLVKGKIKNPSSDLLSKISDNLGLTIDDLIKPSREECILPNLKLVMGNRSIPEFISYINEPGITQELMESYFEKDKEYRLTPKIGTLGLIAEKIGIDVNFFYKENTLESLEKAKEIFANNSAPEISLYALFKKLYESDPEFLMEMCRAKDLPDNERKLIKDMATTLSDKHNIPPKESLLFNKLSNSKSQT